MSRSAGDSCMDASAAYRLLLATLLALAAAITVHSEPVQLDTREYELSIPRQGVSDALLELSHQTGVQLGYIPTTAEEEATLVGPLNGRYTIAMALAKMLDPI